MRRWHRHHPTQWYVARGWTPPNPPAACGTEEKRKELEIDRIEAETAKLKTETDRMVLSNNLDKVKLTLTAAATTAVVVALESIGRRCVMFERYVNLTENIRVERNWWVLLKYGVGLSLLGIVPTVIVFWLWIL